MKKTVVALVSWVGLLAAACQLHGAVVPRRSVLPNGAVLLTAEQRTLPMVTLELLLDAGSRHDISGQEGLANLTSRLLMHGTKLRNSREISEALDFIGASLTTGCTENLASVSLMILKKDLAVGMELLADILTSAVFPEDEIARQKQSVIAGIRAREEDPGDVAERSFFAALYPDSPDGRPVEGTEVSVKSISQENLRQFYTRYYRPNGAIVSVVGDVSHDEIAQALNQHLRSWPKGEPPIDPRPPKTVGPAQIIRVNKELTQANIILGHDGMPRNNPDHYAIQVMNYVLGGGGFSSRAIDSIRNEGGLAYSVYSYFSAGKAVGTFQFVMQTKNETAQEAIRIAREEIRRMREQSVTEQELSDAKDYLIGSFPLRFDTNRKVGAFLAQVEYFELGLDYADRYADFIRKVTREDVLRVAQRYLHPERLIVVTVGDQKKIGEK